MKSLLSRAGGLFAAAVVTTLSVGIAASGWRAVSASGAQTPSGSEDAEAEAHFPGQMEAGEQPATSDYALTLPNAVPAPDFSLPAMDGETFRLSRHRGKVVVLNFWATWCPPCRAEIPDFVKLQKELGARGLVIAGVSLDEEGWGAVRPFAEEFKINYPVMISNAEVDAAYGPIASLPTTFIIDRKGVVREYAPGMVTEEVLRPVLLALLEE